MRRILVPLDGTEMAASILPEAQRFAGREGELVLMRNAAVPMLDYGLHEYSSRIAIAKVHQYLEQQAEALRAAGTRVQIQTFVMGDVAMAIDEGARLFHADMIACATHGRGPLGRLLRGGTAWKALAHSEVPVLLRHPAEHDNLIPLEPRRSHIMVPLDGSALAESALPLAQQLAHEWGASLHLVRVAPYPTQATTMTVEIRSHVREGNDYLQRLTRDMSGDIHTAVLTGPVVEALAQATEKENITDIVLASHGRTGLTRVVLGSVADGLIHRLHCPIVVVPALAARTMERDVHAEAAPLGQS